MIKFHCMKAFSSRSKPAILVWLLGLVIPALVSAQPGSVRVDNFELLYSVVNTTFVEPDTAALYQLVRAKDRAFINLAVREELPDGSSRPVSARFKGRTWDLFQNQFLEFREIREGAAIYYIADFEFSDSEIRFFDIDWAAEGMQRSSNLRFKQKVYEE